MQARILFSTISLAACLMLPSLAAAQCAGCNADQNKADRAEVEKQKKIEQIEKNDPPLKNDPVGNALIGGAVGGATGGISGAAGATVRGATAATTVEVVKEKVKDDDD